VTGWGADGGIVAFLSISFLFIFVFFRGMGGSLSLGPLSTYARSGPEVTAALGSAVFGYVTQPIPDTGARFRSCIILGYLYVMSPHISFSASGNV
jgi:hypothetical protein